MTTITAQRVNTAPRSRLAPVAAYVSVAASAAFLLILAALHLLKSDLDPSWRMISEYEIGRHGWLMQTAFIILAVATVATVVATRPYITRKTGTAGLVLLLVAAAGMILAGLAVSDPITASGDELTGHGNLHGLGALLGIPTFPLAATLVGRGLRDGWIGADARGALRVATAATWVGLAQFGIAMLLFLPANGGAFGPQTPIGLPNRLLILTYVAWLVTVAVQAMRAPGTPRT